MTRTPAGVTAFTPHGPISHRGRVTDGVPDRAATGADGRPAFKVRRPRDDAVVVAVLRYMLALAGLLGASAVAACGGGDVTAVEQERLWARFLDEQQLRVDPKLRLSCRPSSQALGALVIRLEAESTARPASFSTRSLNVRGHEVEDGAWRRVDEFANATPVRVQVDPGGAVEREVDPPDATRRLAVVTGHRIAFVDIRGCR